jgi:signal transduction histidine kinase
MQNSNKINEKLNHFSSTSNNSSVSNDFKINIPNIMKSWRERVKSEVKVAAFLDTSTLENALPYFLDGLAKIISTDLTSQNKKTSLTKTSETCREHGQQRAAIPNYTLDLVISEYRILRITLFDYLEKHFSLNSSERNKILDAIDIGISEAAIAFTKYKGFNQVSLDEESKRNIITFKSKLDQSRKDRNQMESQRDDSLLLINELTRERELRENFISTLSHDLRNPISSAKSCAELLIRLPNNSKKHLLLSAKIIGNLDRTNRMIEDLLDFNRIYAGGSLNLKLKKFNLRELAQTTLDELATVYGNRFELTSDRDIIGTWSPEGLRRVIENLITNAVKYGDPLEPILVNLQKKNDQAMLSVHNQGNPISQDDLPNLFKPFHRLESAKQGKEKGWGLGLTLVKGIGEAHGGSVNVESSHDKGTTFTVTLPIKPLD